MAAPSYPERFLKHEDLAHETLAEPQPVCANYVCCKLTWYSGSHVECGRHGKVYKALDMTLDSNSLDIKLWYTLHINAVCLQMNQEDSLSGLQRSSFQKPCRAHQELEGRPSGHVCPSSEQCTDTCLDGQTAVPEHSCKCSLFPLSRAKGGGQVHGVLDLPTGDWCIYQNCLLVIKTRESDSEIKILLIKNGAGNDQLTLSLHLPRSKRCMNLLSSSLFFSVPFCCIIFWVLQVLDVNFGQLVMDSAPWFKVDFIKSFRVSQSNQIYGNISLFCLNKKERF